MKRLALLILLILACSRTPLGLHAPDGGSPGVGGRCSLSCAPVGDAAPDVAFITESGGNDGGGGVGGAPLGSGGVGSGGVGGAGAADARTGTTAIGSGGADANGVETGGGGTGGSTDAAADENGVALCGNGVLDPGETCDDGNLAGSDGCSATCAVETDFVCSGTPSACNRSCSGLPQTCGPSGDLDCCASNLVPGGTFYRSYDGVTYADWSYPATVSAFRLDNYEITVGRFRKFVAAYTQHMIARGAGKNPNNPADPGWDSAWDSLLPADRAALSSALETAPEQRFSTWTGGNDNLPMNCIDWYEAEAFCIWDGGRLPTEAEWNYAASGGTEQRVYPWGSTEPADNTELAVYGCYYHGSGPSTCTGVTNYAPVGSIAAGNGKWGQADLAGNLWEWVQDAWVSPYGNPCNNCAWLTLDPAWPMRVARGGDLFSDASELHSAERYRFQPLDEAYNMSFHAGARCARPSGRPVCGNGTIDPGEECDDGILDGSYGGCTAQCALAPHCGDGIINGPEQCDDGADNGRDGLCPFTCHLFALP